MEKQPHLTTACKLLGACEATAIAVYCTEQKKCVMIFNSTIRSDKYVFAPLKYSTSRTRYLAQNKGKTNKNVFGKQLAFRYANKEQREILGEDAIIILDESFVRKEVVQVKPRNRFTIGKQPLWVQVNS